MTFFGAFVPPPFVFFDALAPLPLDHIKSRAALPLAKPLTMWYNEKPREAKAIRGIASIVFGCFALVEAMQSVTRAFVRKVSFCNSHSYIKIYL